MGIAGILLSVCLLAGLAGCSLSAGQSGDRPRGEPMSVDQFAQTDFNRTVTMAMRDNLESIYRLQEKLYRRNPRYWRNAGFADLQTALEDGREAIRTARAPAGLEGLADVEILAVALDPAYDGNRVAAFIFGLADMVLAAHNDKSRFYIADQLDAQRIHNAARNVDIAAWMLRSRVDAQGQPLLLANEITEGQVNVSFEHEFGQLAGRLDLVASLLDENIRRVGIGYVQGLLFFSFLPVR